MYVSLTSALHFVLGKTARRADADVVILQRRKSYRHADFADPIWRSAPIQISFALSVFVVTSAVIIMGLSW